MPSPFADLEELADQLARHGYFADLGLATALFLALDLDKPLLLEGEPGVGKTAVAGTLATVLGRKLIRLQCYEGIDSGQAIYEWNHARQLLHLRDAGQAAVTDLYGEEFLIERPLLRALRSRQGAVLLVDEIDRADAEFEAFLLEFLGEGRITIPEIGTIVPEVPPIVVLTSNRTRELHDALRRRCLYHWIDFPDRERERRILEWHAPGLSGDAAQSLIEAVAGLRRLPMVKRPGVAETIEWCRAARVLGARGAEWPTALRRSLGLVVKDREDLLLVASEIEQLLTAAGA